MATIDARVNDGPRHARAFVAEVEQPRQIAQLWHVAGVEISDLDLIGHLVVEFTLGTRIAKPKHLRMRSDGLQLRGIDFHPGIPEQTVRLCLAVTDEFGAE
ncbi:MAG: hypothetical protein BWZ07_01367 [Alphaproteobacteria bacterium ADurb.BinA280]|nr:MAG: hypothetical protein BWZ07_01367 [Alphaproteobacteria bacterium ADurb.BinA280]